MTKNHWTLAVWLRIQEPRFITIMQTLIYGLCAWAGIATVGCRLRISRRY